GAARGGGPCSRVRFQVGRSNLAVRKPDHSRAGRCPGRWLALSLLLGLLGTLPSPLRAAAGVLRPGATNELSLQEFLRLVLERNETLHGRILEFEINQKRFKAEQAAFEPEWVL